MAVIELFPTQNSVQTTSTARSTATGKTSANPRFHAELETALQNLSSSKKEIAQQYLFEVMAPNGNTSIQIRDAHTRELIRELDPKELLTALKNIRAVMRLDIENLSKAPKTL